MWPVLFGLFGMAGVPMAAAQSQTQPQGQARTLDADLERCRSLSEASERLKCYDMIVLPARSAAVGGTSAADRAAAVSPSAGASAAQAPAAPARPAPVAAGEPSAAGIARFGREQEMPAGTLDELRSSIPGTFSGWEPRTRWKLANGQVWQVADGSRAYYRLESPTIRITRGALGSFFMEIEGVSHAVPVRRLE